MMESVVCQAICKSVNTCFRYSQIYGKLYGKDSWNTSNEFLEKFRRKYLNSKKKKNINPFAFYPYLFYLSYLKNSEKGSLDFLILFKDEHLRLNYYLIDSICIKAQFWDFSKITNATSYSYFCFIHKCYVGAIKCTYKQH